MEYLSINYRTVYSLLFEETQVIAGKDPDFNRRDLWESIEAGNYPEFELGIQMLEENELDKVEFDVLDPTKIWPEEDVPVKLIGKMTLNRNPDNFFAETEDHHIKAELGVVTGGTTADLQSFFKDFREALAQHRHWEREKDKDKVP